MTMFNFGLSDIDKVFFTSDQHFMHRNIIDFCDRPYTTVDMMDYCLIENWNNVVSKNDIVFHLGDFSLSNAEKTIPIFEKLNGQINILGIDWHHDKRWLPYARANPVYSKSNHQVKILHSQVVFKVSGLFETSNVYFHLSHYPIGDWNRKYHGSIHLHGHSHGQYYGDNHLTDELCFDVGVDGYGINYSPVSLRTILEWSNKQ